MKFIQLIILLLLGVYTHNDTYAQSSIQWNQVIAETTTAYYDSVLNGDGLLLINTHESKQLSADLSDTTNIAQVRVKLGSQSGSNDLLTQVFSFSGQQVNEMVWFERTGIACKFGLGQYTNFTEAHLTLEVLSSTGAVLGTYSGMLY